MAQKSPISLPLPEQYSKLKRELYVFMIFLGVLLGAAGYFLITKENFSNVRIWGMARNVAWGAPTLAIAGVLLVAGLSLVFTSSALPVLLGMLGSVALAVFYFAVMHASGDELVFNPFAIVVLAVPVAVIIRGQLFLKLKKQLSATAGHPGRV